MSVACAICLREEAVATDTRQRDRHDFALMTHSHTNMHQFSTTQLFSVDKYCQVRMLIKLLHVFFRK